jgi:predicted MFS family arabinose efflux permease
MLGFLTLAAAFAVANLYYAQPLAEQLAREFTTTAAGVSSALVGAQLGYAAGMLLLVPLGDVRERRGVIVATSAGCALALLGFSLAPALPIAAAFAVTIGVGTSVVQMILPFAVGLGEPSERGRIVGTVMGGVLAGILLSRTVSGTLGSVIGWRGVFATAAGIMAVLAVAVRIVLPRSPPTTQLPYRALLASLWRILRRERVLRKRAIIGGLGFATFSMFWSTIVFQLGASPIHGGARLAGLLGILGLSGIVVAPIVGRMAMRIAPVKLNLVALGTIVVAFAVLAIGGDYLIAICAGVVLLDAGAQANHLTNQTVILGLVPAERNRANAIYMVGYFLGGALGTAIAAQAWERGGWLAVCASGAITAIVAVPFLRRSA